jgi:1,4-dihydroxy-2-naphthoyl-CoA hydrolase
VKLNTTTGKSIWFVRPTLDDLQRLVSHTMVEHIGIEFTEVGDDYLKAKMPVDPRTVQPEGLLHGGASAALAETIGSVAGNLCVDHTKRVCVGLEINANHIRAVRNGYVYGQARPLHLGQSTQVWEIEIRDEKQKLVCISRLTMAVVLRNKT